MNAQRPPLPRKMAVIVPAAFMTSLGIGMVSLGYIFVMKGVYGASATVVGWFGATWSMAYFVGCMALRRVTGRMVPRASMAVMLGGAAVVLGASILVHSPVAGFVGYAGFGFLCAFFWPPLMGWLSRGLEREELSRATSLFSLAWSTAGFLSPFLAGLLAEIDEFIPVAVAAVVFALNLVFVLVSRAIVVDPQETNGTGSERRDEPVRPAQDDSTPLRYPAWIGIFAIYAVMGIVFNIFPVYARDELGLSESAIGLVLTVRAIATAAGFLFLGRTAFWHFRRRYIPALSLAAIALVALLAFQDNPLGFALCFGALGLVLAMVYNNSLFYGTSGAPDRDRRATIHEALLTAGQVLGSISGGMLYQAFSLPVVFAALGLLLAAGLTVQIVMVVKRGPART